jgi:hypothetical protein
MADEWRENGETWSAYFEARTIIFKPWSVCGPNDEPLDAREILDNLPWPEGLEFIHHVDGEQIGQAIFIPCEQDGQAMWNLKACTAVDGKFAEFNIFVEDEAELPWALDIWHSLRMDVQEP